MKKPAFMETKRVGKFVLIGVLNTLIDFAVFNIFIYLGLYRIIANIFSTTIGMAFSFAMNRSWVFGSRQGNVLRQAVMFLGVTAFGLYVIQNMVIFFLTEVWLAPLNLAYNIVELIDLDGVFSRSFITNNGAKGTATLFSLTWNYLLYEGIIFKRSAQPKLQTI
jgi:putative flippase GtrA